MVVEYRNYIGEGNFIKFRVNSTGVIIIKGEYQERNSNINKAEVSTCCYVLKTNLSGNGEINTSYKYDIFDPDAIEFETMYNTGKDDRVYYSLEGNGETKELYIYLMKGRVRYEIFSISDFKDKIVDTGELIQNNEIIDNIGTKYFAPQKNRMKSPEVYFYTLVENRNLRTRFLNRNTKEQCNLRTSYELKENDGVYCFNGSGGTILRFTLNRYQQPITFLAIKNSDNNKYIIYDAHGGSNIAAYFNYVKYNDTSIYVDTGNSGQVTGFVEVLLSYTDKNLMSKVASIPEDATNTLTTGHTGTFANKPNNPIKGYYYYCEDLHAAQNPTQGIMIFHAGGNIWIDGNGNIVNESYPNNKLYGNTSNRPSKPYNGIIYYDTDLEQLLIWDVDKYVSCFGDNSNFKTNGTFSEKPDYPKKGYAYFCTDRKTTEGSSNGIMIYHKGNNVWVDALGRVVA